MAGDVLILVGTTKGAFLFRSDAGRRQFTISGPYLGGEEVASIALDGRNGHPRILAGAMSWQWGGGIVTSDNLGETWSDPAERRVKFPEATGAALTRVWQITPAGVDQPNVIFAGVEPAALFKSTDGGETYSLVEGLWNHPHRPTWQPGNGGLCLHTIEPNPTDPKRMLVAISAAGAYRTEDGGETWQARNVGIRADFLPDTMPEYGQCVHKVVRDQVRPSTLYLQNHGGLYRSEDDGDSWTDIADGVPSDFGFPIVAHPRRQGTVYVVPLGLSRWTVDGKCRVYRTQDGGRSWKPLAKGLPQEHAYYVVLRDALACDTLDPTGLYFGTRTGHLYGSADEGESWQLIADTLPPILCVKAAVL